MPLSNYIRKKAIDHLFRNQAFTPPSTIYVALFTTMPTDLDGTAAVEVSAGGYARQALTLSAAGSDGSTASSGAITFPQATANWGTILGWGIYDASSAGNLMDFHVFEQTTTSEVVTLASGLVQLANANVSTVIVKNNTDATTYVENTDYYVQYDLGVICRIAAGAITASQQLHVTYNNPNSQVINSGNRMQINSGDLGLGWKSFK